MIFIFLMKLAILGLLAFMFGVTVHGLWAYSSLWGRTKNKNKKQ